MQKSLIKRFKIPFLILFFLLVGFFIRIYFAPGFIKESGDIRLFADWGEKFWLYGPRVFYTYKVWYYAPPNYPPLLSLIYAGAFWLFDHKYYLAQLHNFIKIPPAAFIIYFYKYGYYLSLKLPGILADIGLSILIYKIIFEITKNRTRSVVGMALYLFNPVTIFLSSVWGQSDSLVAFFGLLSFIMLAKKKILLSIPLFFLSLYIKPNWGIFIPLYSFLLALMKPKIRSLLGGILISLSIFYISTKVFAQGNVFEFAKWLFLTRILPTADVAQKASISAFNFYTIFLKIDYALDSTRILGIIPAYVFGIIAFSLVNLFAFLQIIRTKVSLLSTVTGLFIIGFGGYLFLTNMLERYFFQAFSSMVILMVINPKILLGGLFINTAVFGNIYYSFFRRSHDGVANFFTGNSFLVIKALSLVNLSSFVYILKILNVRLNSPFLLQFMRGASRRAPGTHRRN